MSNVTLFWFDLKTPKSEHICQTRSYLLAIQTDPRENLHSYLQLYQSACSFLAHIIRILIPRWARIASQAGMHHPPLNFIVA